MASFIPDDQVRFAQLAVKQRFIQPEQVRTALELYRRYQAVGGDVPSIPRILVGNGWLDRQKAEILLRHIINGEPIPGAPASQSARTSPPAVSAPMELEVPADSGIDLPGPEAESGVGAQPLVDEREAWIKGMGATVVRKDLVKGYKITQVRGEGAMGIVYRAHQISMDRTVALKVLPAEKTTDQRFVEEFLSEARNTGRLNHPNLIHVHEVGKSGDVYYYSMEYVEGQRLDEWMDECEGGRIDAKQAVQVFAQVAGALDYGYRAGVIHREIRPNTVMVNEDGQAKLADLGLTKGEQTRFLEGENAFYVAPEQVNMGGQIDTRADIYSLGCCLFHCLTGEPPFEGGTRKEVLFRRSSAPVPNVLDYNPNLPPDLARVVMKMMARNPGDRYQTPAEAADALKNVNFALPKKPMMGRGGMRRPLPGARAPMGRKPAPPSGRQPPARPHSGLSAKNKKRPGGR